MKYDKIKQNIDIESVENSQGGHFFKIIIGIIIE